MTAKYWFEEELLRDYDFEPWQDCYRIDDLKENDREELSGMLYAFYNAMNFFENEKEENEKDGLLGKLRQEYLEDVKDRLEAVAISDIDQYILSVLDSYEE